MTAGTSNLSARALQLAKRQAEERERNGGPSLFDPRPATAPAVQEPNYGRGFYGVAYDPALDKARLTGQLRRVYELMSDGRWRTVAQIAETTGDPSPSVLAQLGHLRKERFGAYLVERRRATSSGLFEYRVGAKGDGTPHPRSCKRCLALEVAIAELKARLGEA